MDVLIGIPLSAVIMGIVMLTLAIQSWSGLVVDDYYRKGKQINRVLARDKLAYELGLAASFRRWSQAGSRFASIHRCQRHSGRAHRAQTGARYPART